MFDKEDAAGALREDLSKKVKDKFDAGDVIRWTGGGRFAYCAIKCGNSLWSISGTGIWYGTEQKTYEQIVDILERSDVTDIEVSVEWVKVS